MEKLYKDSDCSHVMYENGHHLINLTKLLGESNANEIFEFEQLVSGGGLKLFHKLFPVSFEPFSVLLTEKALNKITKHKGG